MIIREKYLKQIRPFIYKEIVEYSNQIGRNFNIIDYSTSTVRHIRL